MRRPWEGTVRWHPSAMQRGCTMPLHDMPSWRQISCAKIPPMPWPFTHGRPIHAATSQPSHSVACHWAAMHWTAHTHPLPWSNVTARHGIGRHWLLVLGIRPLLPHPCRHFHAVPFGGMPLFKSHLEMTVNAQLLLCNYLITDLGDDS